MGRMVAGYLSHLDFAARVEAMTATGKLEPFVVLAAVLGPAVVEVRFVAIAVALLASS